MVATIGLDLILIPHYGVTGAAVASAVAYGLYGASSVLALARICRPFARRDSSFPRAPTSAATRRLPGECSAHEARRGY